MMIKRKDTRLQEIFDVDEGNDNFYMYEVVLMFPNPDAKKKPESIEMEEAEEIL